MGELRQALHVLAAREEATGRAGDQVEVLLPLLASDFDLDPAEVGLISDTWGTGGLEMASVVPLPDVFRTAWFNGLLVGLMVMRQREVEAVRGDDPDSLSVDRDA